ncbi:unnamed protein product [Periconia digitata]|uniref:Stc1 domain-containing protein n=1 Tax=Periconia digitata TaxID=1303443 RepID=A0A9W4U3C8_9PLEO|nr:unnamed protein product [Periconia digitata]
MARKNKSFYDASQMRALEGIPLPEKIKCARCNNFLTQKKFSNTQLAHARTQIKNHGRNVTYQINCQSCTGVQVVEIQCVACCKTKGLEEFAKSQRRDVDKATCYACVDEQLAVDPIDEEVYDSPDRTKLFIPEDVQWESQPSQWTGGSTIEASENNTWTQDDEDGGIALGSELQNKLSLGPASQKGTLIDTSTNENDQFGWQSQRTKSWRSSATSAVSVSSGFDPSKYGKPGPNNGSLKSFDSGFVEKPGSATPRKAPWAKIKAYNPKTDGPSPATSSQTKTNNGKDDWSSSESENEEDAEDDSDDDDDDDDDDTVI